MGKPKPGKRKPATFISSRSTHTAAAVNPQTELDRKHGRNGAAWRYLAPIPFKPSDPRPPFGYSLQRRCGFCSAPGMAYAGVRPNAVLFCDSSCARLYKRFSQVA